MNDLKERALIILIILLFSFWYVFTGYLLLDYFIHNLQIDRHLGIKIHAGSLPS